MFVPEGIVWGRIQISYLSKSHILVPFIFFFPCCQTLNVTLLFLFFFPALPVYIVSLQRSLVHICIVISALYIGRVLLFMMYLLSCNVHGCVHIHVRPGYLNAALALSSKSAAAPSPWRCENVQTHSHLEWIRLCVCSRFYMRMDVWPSPPRATALQHGPLGVCTDSPSVQPARHIADSAQQAVHFGPSVRPTYPHMLR